MVPTTSATIAMTDSLASGRPERPVRQPHFTS